MDDEKVKRLFEQAETALDSARKELYQPAEDVVNYSVCVFARNALYQYLTCLYLMDTREHDDAVKESPSLEDLIAYCSNYNEDLKSLDFSSVYCKGKVLIGEDEEDIYYCNDVFKVKDCAGLAESVRKMVLAKA